MACALRRPKTGPYSYISGATAAASAKRPTRRRFPTRGRRLRLPSGERITERELGTRYRAFVTPVFTYLTPEGRAVGQRIGIQTAQDLLEADAEAQQALRLQPAP